MSATQQYSVDAARQAAERDELGNWVADFLASPGSDNAPLAAKLTSPPRSWLGPVQLPIDQLHRLAGPSGQPVLVEWDDEEWRDDVEDLKERAEDGWEPPPVIVSWRAGQLIVEDGNHRLEGLRRAGETAAWGIVGFDDADQRARFRPPPVP